MKKTIMFLGFLLQLFSGKTQKNEFSSYPVYKGNDLGLMYTPLQSVFRIWAPTAEEAQLFIYEDGIIEKATQTIVMNKDLQGTWKVLLQGDHKGKYYTFRVRIKDSWMNPIPDPYAKAVGINGKRALIIDLRETNPANWSNDKSPVFKNKTDAIIYELHMRDAGIAENSGIKNKGKFLGLTESGTKNTEGLSTGLDHLKELGVTHIHLLPSFDFNSIDESKTENQQYNWGYDPLNYNVPEGSYSTNASDGSTRIREFKQLVRTFHENGLRVILDVAYNHTGLTGGRS